MRKEYLIISVLSKILSKEEEDKLYTKKELCDILYKEFHIKKVSRNDPDKELVKTSKNFYNCISRALKIMCEARILDYYPTESEIKKLANWKLGQYHFNKVGRVVFENEGKIDIYVISRINVVFHFSKKKVSNSFFNFSSTTS